MFIPQLTHLAKVGIIVIVGMFLNIVGALEWYTSYDVWKILWNITVNLTTELGVGCHTILALPSYILPLSSERLFNS